MTKPSYEELARKSDAMADILAHALRCGYLPTSTAFEAETILKGGDVGQQSALFQSLTQSLARVRGLLQRAHGSVMGNLSRMRREFTGCKGVLATSAWRDSIEHQEKLLGEIEQVLEPDVSSGAESADIGKLDTADESGVEMGKVNRVDEEK